MKSNHNCHKFFYLCSLLSLLFAIATPANMAFAQTVREKTITRVFWQDRESEKLAYADLKTTDKWHIKRGWVAGFPEVDSSKHQLGPMQQIGTTLMLAINSKDEEQPSQLVALDSGVFEEPHGNHFHWKYTKSPGTTLAQPIQGRALSAVAIDKHYYFTFNTKRFATAAPELIRARGNSNAVRVFAGGGPDSSIAAINNSMAYATWNSGEGTNAGQVDLIDLRNPNNKLGSFKLGSGNIAASIANSGKVFFAHANGISWIAANQSFSTNERTPKINRVGNDTLTTLPTELVSDRNWVLFTNNSAGATGLCMVNASLARPSIIKLPISVEPGLQLSSPKTKLSLGKRYAFLFQERMDPKSDIKEQLTVIELDPNRDFDFSDAQVKTVIPIDASKIEGEHGHHHICFDAYGRFAVFTSPGDGLLSVMTLNDMKIRVRFRVGGAPDRIVAVGAPEHFH